MPIRPSLLCIALAAIASVSSAQTDAMAAYQAKDYARFLTLEKHALALDPTNARLLYNVACGEALQGHATQAVGDLDSLLSRKLDLGAETDGDFVPIHATPEWASYLTRLAALRTPLVHSTVAFTLSDSALLATGLAIDSKTGDTFIASSRERKIVRRTKDGVVSDFIHTAQNGFLASASLAIDSTRRILYATTAGIPYMLGYTKDEDGRSGIFAFDLTTGTLMRKVLLPPDAQKHFLNALVIDQDGTVYISDSRASGLYRLRPNATTLEPFVPGMFESTQGLAFSADHRTLYVQGWTDGVWALDRATNVRRKLDGPPGVWLGGLDGISPVADGFISVQIGVAPARVLRLHLDPAHQRIAAVDVLEMSHPAYAEPIQGIVYGIAFLYIANSQLGLGNVETGAFAADRARPTQVLRLPL